MLKKTEEDLCIGLLHCQAAPVSSGRS